MADASSRVSPIPTIMVTLDRPRQLVLDMAALFRAEQRFRELRHAPLLSIFEFIEELTTVAALGLTELAVFLWAGTAGEDGGLTEQQVLAAMTPGAIADLSTACGAALRAQFSTEESKESNGDGMPPRPFAPLPGSPSGPSPGTTSASPAASSGA